MEIFRVLPGLPTSGPWPEQFSSTGQGMHREGFVVEFSPEGKPPWVGNFQPGMTGYSAVLQHLDGTSLIVIAAPAYQLSAKFTNVRTATPDGPFARNGFPSSSQAVPAMSRCTHGLSS